MKKSKPVLKVIEIHKSVTGYKYAATVDGVIKIFANTWDEANSYLICVEEDWMQDAYCSQT